jgi:Dienelactone hydrolase family
MQHPGVRRRTVMLLVAALLAWSWFARPAYEYAWIVAIRLAEAVEVRIGHPLLRTERQASVDSHVQQADEIDAYLKELRARRGRETAPGESATAGSEGARPEAALLRARLAHSLGYPPPGFDAASPAQPPEERLLGEDELASYWELRIPVLPGLHASGVYARPRGADPRERLPLLIGANGRYGVPGTEPDGKFVIVQRTVRDMSYDALRHGYAVWVPILIYYGPGHDENFRDRLAVRAWESGASLPAIEIAKLEKTIDAFSARGDVDPQRIAMMGFSYGGFYALYTAALDPRIRAAAVMGYFNDREAVLRDSEPYGYLDWRFADSTGLWRDPVVASLIAPRGLLVESGTRDQLFPIDGARRAAAETTSIYHQLGAGDRFRFAEFVGRHEFNGSVALDFIDRQLHQAPH